MKNKFDLNFKLIIISKIISVVGGSVLGFAMILFLVDFTGSAAMLGIITAVSQLPTVLITPVAGMIADRFDKKKLIVFFDITKAISNFIFLALLLTNTYTILNITLLRMFKISNNVFAQTVFTASIPRIVKDDNLVAANGAMQSISAIGLIGGSVIGGILFGVVSIELIALGSGIVFFISAAISMFIKIPHVIQKAVGGMFETVKSDMKESLAFLKNEKTIIIKLALIASTITLIFPPIFNIGLPFIVGVVFGSQVTLSFGVAAVGMLAGGICAGKLSKYLAIKNMAKWVFAIGTTSIFLAIAFMDFIPNLSIGLWIFNVTLACLLFIFALLNSSFGAFIQKEVPPHLLGKVNSLLQMISLIAGPMGIMAVGFFIETIHLPNFFFGITAVTWILALVCGCILKGYFNSNEGK